MYQLINYGNIAKIGQYIKVQDYLIFKETGITDGRQKLLPTKESELILNKTSILMQAMLVCRLVHAWFPLHQ